MPKIQKHDTSFFRVKDKKADEIRDHDLSKDIPRGGVTIDTARQQAASEALQTAVSQTADKNSMMYEKQQDFKFKDNKISKS